MYYMYIAVRDGKVRDLIDQQPDDQHSLERYLEVGEHYDMSKLNAGAFRSINTQSMDTVK